MKIPFRKVGNTPQDFTLLKDKTTFKGTLEHFKHGLIMLDAHLEGAINLPCDICAENFDTILNEELKFLLSDGIFNGHDEDYDVVEFLDGMIDIDEVLSSEIESLKSDYHSCEECKKQN